MPAQTPFATAAPCGWLRRRTAGLVRLYDSQGVFLGLGEIAGTGELIPKRLVDQANTKAALGFEHVNPWDCLRKRPFSG